MNNATAFIILAPLFLCWYLFGTENGTIVFGVIAVGLITYLIRASIANTERQTNVLKQCIQNHLSELALKHRQMTFSSSYGIVDLKKWNKEKKRFIDLVFAPLVGGRAAITLSEQTIYDAIDQAVKSASDEGKKLELEKLGAGATGIDYEYFCGSLFKSNGWQTQVTAASGDQGADIVATKNGKKLVAQCKYFTGNVGNAAVQQVAAARTFYEADIAVVISNAGYTKSAQQLAKSLNVQLLHHDAISSIKTVAISSI